MYIYHKKTKLVYMLVLHALSSMLYSAEAVENSQLTLGNDIYLPSELVDKIVLPNDTYHELVKTSTECQQVFSTTLNTIHPIVIRIEKQSFEGKRIAKPQTPGRYFCQTHYIQNTYEKYIIFSDDINKKSTMLFLTGLRGTTLTFADGPNVNQTYVAVINAPNNGDFILTTRLDNYKGYGTRKNYFHHNSYASCSRLEQPVHSLTLSPIQDIFLIASGNRLLAQTIEVNESAEKSITTRGNFLGNFFIQKTLFDIDFKKKLSHIQHIHEQLYIALDTDGRINSLSIDRKKGQAELDTKKIVYSDSSNQKIEDFFITIVSNQRKGGNFPFCAINKQGEFFAAMITDRVRLYKITCKNKLNDNNSYILDGRRVKQWWLDGTLLSCIYTTTNNIDYIVECDIVKDCTIIKFVQHLIQGTAKDLRLNKDDDLTKKIDHTNETVTTQKTLPLTQATPVVPPSKEIPIKNTTQISTNANTQTQKNVTEPSQETVLPSNNQNTPTTPLIPTLNTSKPTTLPVPTASKKIFDFFFSCIAWPTNILRSLITHAPQSTAYVRSTLLTWIYNFFK